MSLARNLNKILSLRSLAAQNRLFNLNNNLINRSLLINSVQKRYLSNEQEPKIEIKISQKAVPHFYRCSVNDPVSNL